MRYVEDSLIIFQILPLRNQKEFVMWYLLSTDRHMTTVYDWHMTTNSNGCLTFRVPRFT